MDVRETVARLVAGTLIGLGRDDDDEGPNDEGPNADANSPGGWVTGQGVTQGDEVTEVLNGDANIPGSWAKGQGVSRGLAVEELKQQPRRQQKRKRKQQQKQKVVEGEGGERMPLGEAGKGEMEGSAQTPSEALLAAGGGEGSTDSTHTAHTPSQAATAREGTTHTPSGAAGQGEGSTPVQPEVRRLLRRAAAALSILQHLQPWILSGGDLTAITPWLRPPSAAAAAAAATGGSNSSDAGRRAGVTGAGVAAAGAGVGREAKRARKGQGRGGARSGGGPGTVHKGWQEEGGEVASVRGWTWRS